MVKLVILESEEIIGEELNSPILAIAPLYITVNPVCIKSSAMLGKSGIIVWTRDSLSKIKETSTKISKSDKMSETISYL